MHLSLTFRYPGKYNIYLFSLKEVNTETSYYYLCSRVKKKVWNES